MLRVSLWRRIANISVLGENADLRRNVFTMEGHGKGNVVPCVTEGDKEQDEVKIWKNFNSDGTCQNIE
jgi:hypothetical protein